MGNTCCAYIIKPENKSMTIEPVKVDEMLEKICEEVRSEENKKEASLASKKKFIPKIEDESKKGSSPLKNGKTADITNKNNLQIYDIHGNLVPNSLSLNPNLPSKNQASNESNFLARNDLRALTTQNNSLGNNPQEKKKFDPMKSINLDELKLSEEINKKLDKIGVRTIPRERKQDKSSVLRSMTLGDNEDFEEEVGEGTNTKTKKEKIKKELIENKKDLEKMASGQNFDRMKSGEPHKKEDKKLEGSLQNSENESNFSLPRKSLLKRCKTIGAEGKKDKNKKKVKFKDLFDGKGNKKKTKGRMKKR